MNRYLCRGRRCDNGDWETGSYVVTAQNLSNERHYIADKMTGYLTPVDPATVEPMKVAPDSTPVAFGAFAPICPNCKQQLSGEKYCPDCGQALSWDEGSTECARLNGR